MQGFLQRLLASPQRAAADRKVVVGGIGRVAGVGASHTHRMRVAYGDCDPSGVVFNPNYLAFYDVALTEFWRAVAGGYGAMMDEGVDLQVVEATLRYKAPARFDDELDVTIEVARLGTTSMVTSGAIHRDGALLVELDLAYVFVDAAALTKVPIPERFRTAFAG